MVRFTILLFCTCASLVHAVQYGYWKAQAAPQYSYGARATPAPAPAPSTPSADYGTLVADLIKQSQPQDSLPKCAPQIIIRNRVKRIYVPYTVEKRVPVYREKQVVVKVPVKVPVYVPVKQVNEEKVYLTEPEKYSNDVPAQDTGNTNNNDNSDKIFSMFDFNPTDKIKRNIKGIMSKFEDQSTNDNIDNTDGGNSKDNSYSDYAPMLAGSNSVLLSQSTSAATSGDDDKADKASKVDDSDESDSKSK